jgi:hypothetical protein
MSKPKYCFDSKCLELAEHFLPSTASQTLKNDLAQAIQNEVENFCTGEWMKEDIAALRNNQP